MWDKVFNADNPFWNGMGKVYDMFILNVFLLIFSIPIVTIGPALTAFSYGEIAMVRNEDSYTAKDFMKSFKLNFKKGMKLGIPMTLVGAFLALDVYMCRVSGTGIYTFFMFFFAIFFIVWAAVASYAFPVLAKFEYSLPNVLVIAFTKAISKFPLTIGMLVSVLIGVWLIRLIPGLVFIVPGIIGGLNAELFLLAFKKELPVKTYEIEEVFVDDED